MFQKKDLLLHYDHDLYIIVQILSSRPIIVLVLQR